ncbi:MAG: hypothetical protein ACLUFN_09565 [Eubacterium sp.]
MKKLFGILFSVIAFIYTVWYMHFGVPYLNSGALSKIGLYHHTYFVIWGFLTFLALCYNTVLAYTRYTKSRVYIPLLVFSAVGMLLTLSFDFDFSKKPDYYFHCAGSLAFSVLMGITIFVLFALCYKKDKIFKVFSVITAVILIADLVCLIIYKETALIETLPVFAGYIMLCIVNLRRDRVEAVR